MSTGLLAAIQELTSEHLAECSENDDRIGSRCMNSNVGAIALTKDMTLTEICDAVLADNAEPIQDDYIQALLLLSVRCTELMFK